MQESVVARLLELNREFYQSFAEPFSQTRDRLQPGVLRALEIVPEGASILDLGCGHGLLAAHLQESKHWGPYVGLDLSLELIEMARNRASGPGIEYVQADLAQPDWSKRLVAAAPEGAKTVPLRFDCIYAFATLHHVPSASRRQALLSQLRELLSDNGSFTLSVWNFLASPRLRRRIVPWRELGLRQEQLEEGDFLLDWRHGGAGLRYVHHFTESELNALAAAAGFQVAKSYLSDGEGGHLGRYQVWEPV